MIEDNEEKFEESNSERSKDNNEVEGSNNLDVITEDE